MNETDFSYQTYVKKMAYEPYDWPPDISLAGLHSRCSQPGKSNPVGVSCPCCGYRIKLKVEGWIKRDIYQDFQQTGAGIPAYFSLLRFYNLIVLILFLVNAPFYIYATNLACDLKKDSCVDIGFLYFLDFEMILKILSQAGYEVAVNTLLALQTLVFYILLIANNISIFYLVFVSRKCKSSKKSTKRFMSLIIENFPPGTTEQQINKLLVLSNGSHPKIINISFIRSLYYFNKVFKERVLAYFQLKAMYIECIDPRKQFLKNQKLRILNDQFNKLSGEIDTTKIKAIIMFESHRQLMEVYEKYKYREYSYWIQRVYNWFARENKKSEVFVNFLPELSETLWINMGEDHKVKLISKIISLGITIVLLVLCYALFYYPLMFALGVDSTAHEQTKMTIAQKFLPTLIALGLVGISILFRMYMQKLGRDRRPRTTYEQSHFILTTTIMFHLIFYLVIPTIFFTFDNGLSRSVKLFAISSQARTFLFIQLILSFLDVIFRLWRVKKMNTLADQREAFKYPQRFLHEKVQYREYPIEIKLIVMFKIWSLVLFYSFFVPIVMFYIVVAMLLLYLLEKRNIYQHYAVRKYLSSKLEVRFLNLYINFFCIYECFIYVVNVTSTWQQILAGASTILSLLLQFIYWQVLKKRENKRHQYKIMKATSDMRRSASNPIELTNRIQEELVESDLESDDDDPTYGSVYERFLEQYNQPKLDQEIEKYLKTTSMMQNIQIEAERLRESDMSFEQKDSVRKESTVEMA